MVQLVEVEDEHFQERQPGPEDEGDFTDTDSEISVDSDYDPTSETLVERITALKDVVPPTTRAWFSARYATTKRFMGTAGVILGRTGWSLCTSALLVGVPFALLWSEESQLVEMEREQRMREQGGEMLTAGADALGEGNTADQVGAALARPAL